MGSKDGKQGWEARMGSKDGNIGKRYLSTEIRQGDKGERREKHKEGTSRWSRSISQH
jgi:hypothetical protein